MRKIRRNYHKDYDFVPNTNAMCVRGIYISKDKTTLMIDSLETDRIMFFKIKEREIISE